jgi:hypothetical protein
MGDNILDFEQSIPDDMDVDEWSATPGLSQLDPASTGSSEVSTPIDTISLEPFLSELQSPRSQHLVVEDDGLQRRKTLGGEQGLRPWACVSHRSQTTATLIQSAFEHDTFGAISMDIAEDATAGPSAPPQRGHSRYKHSLRNWSGIVPLARPKRFSLGHQTDCGRCGDGMAGNFGHVVMADGTVCGM